MLIFKVDRECGIEMLPQAPIWEVVEGRVSGQRKKLIELYSLIQQEQNWYQVYTPTAFGDPDFTRIEGLAAGYCSGVGFIREEDSDWIYIKNWTGKKTLMQVEKPKKPDSYKEAIRENQKARRALGL